MFTAILSLTEMLIIKPFNTSRLPRLREPTRHNNEHTVNSLTCYQPLLLSQEPGSLSRTTWTTRTFELAYPYKDLLSSTLTAPSPFFLSLLMIFIPNHHTHSNYFPI